MTGNGRPTSRPGRATPEPGGAARRLHPGIAGSAAVDRLTELATHILRVPSSLVSLVDEVASVIGGAGLPNGIDRGDVPAAESLCALSVAQQRPVSIADTRADPRSAVLPTVQNGQVGCFLGVPLSSDLGVVVGALCVFSPQPRIWSQDDVGILQALGTAVVAELELAALTREHDMTRARWDLAIESAGVGSFDWDLRSGRLAWDQPLVDLFGYGDDDRFDESIEAFNARVHPDDLPVVAAALQHAIDAVGDVEVEYRVVLPDGRVRDVQARGRAIGSDETGEGGAERLLGAAWDVSETRRAERRAERILAAMPVGHVSLTGDGVITAANSAAELVLGAPRVSLEGHTLSARLPGTSAAEFAAASRRAVGTREPVTVEVLLDRSPDRWLDVRIWPEQDGLSVFLTDITDRVVVRERDAAAAAHDRTVAGALQEALLTRLPDTDRLELAGRYLPASATDKVGGDWYDAIAQPDGATTIVIGDVAGHDIGAAANMGQLRSMLRAFIWESDRPPSQVATRLDRVMQDLCPGVMATAVLARIEQTDADRLAGLRTLRWTNCGHPPPLLLHDTGRVEVLDEQFGLLLGVSPDAARQDYLTTIPADATVLLYTDGLIETRTADLDHGIARLVDAVTAHRHEPLQDLLDHVVADMVGNNAEDDVALVAVRCGREVDV